jgi:hypothetical protein
VGHVEISQVTYRLILSLASLEGVVHQKQEASVGFSWVAAPFEKNVERIIKT